MKTLITVFALAGMLCTSPLSTAGETCSVIPFTICPDNVKVVALHTITIHSKSAAQKKAEIKAATPRGVAGGGEQVTYIQQTPFIKPPSFKAPVTVIPRSLK